MPDRTRPPSESLRQRLIKATRAGRDAHGSVPFMLKLAWQQGYDEAKRQFLDAADRIEAEDASAPAGES